VLFGYYFNQPTNCAETWEWDGATWKQAAACAGPVPMFGHAMAYDSRRGVTVLFGGTLDINPLGTTWEWDGIKWIKRATTGPPPRVNFPMAYDSTRGVCVLFSGEGDGGDGFSDSGTWEWDGTNWALRTTIGGPAHSMDASMVYDSNNGVCVLVGGWNGNSYNGNTYTWNGTAWTVCSSGGPSPRGSSAMAYDSARLATVLFGGDSGGPTLYGDTWEFQPPLLLYVDGGTFLPVQDGSSQFPFRTIRQAVDAGGNGTTISIRAGNYSEAPIIFSKRGSVLATQGAVYVH
jgi:hypothetical protein